MFTPSSFQLAQEDDFAISLLHADIVVLDACEVLLHLVELVIVGGKERASLCLGMFVEIFYDGPRDRDTIIG